MKKDVIIIRGCPASGKTSVSLLLRDCYEIIFTFAKKIIANGT